MEDDSASNFFRQTRALKDAIVKAAVSLLFPPDANIPDACLTVSDNRAQARGEILTELRKIGCVPKDAAFKDIFGDITHLDSFLKTVEEVSLGAYHFMEQNFDETRVDEFPALNFHRVYTRKVPRGFKSAESGMLMSVPSDDWPSRWSAAAQESGDHSSMQILQKTGKMIALKSSGIWQALGNGAGGYVDTLGNPFPPFALGSGFDVDEVPRGKCEKLGLLKVGEKAEFAIIPSHDEIAGNFAAKLRQYLPKLN